MITFLKKNLVTVLIVLATLVLAGVAIYTAVRLYQLRQTSVAPNAPESQPAAAGKACTVSFSLGASPSPSESPSGSPSPTPIPPIICAEGPVYSFNSATVIDIPNKFNKNESGGTVVLDTGKVTFQIPQSTVGGGAFLFTNAYFLGDFQADAHIQSFTSGSPTNTENAAQMYVETSVFENVLVQITINSNGKKYATLDSNPNGQFTERGRIEIQQTDDVTLRITRVGNIASGFIKEGSGSFQKIGETSIDIASNGAKPVRVVIDSWQNNSASAGTTAVFNSLQISCPSTSSPSPSPTPVPQCGESCTSSADCPNGMTCSGNLCRNTQCTTETDCICATASPSATPQPTPLSCGDTCTSNADCSNSMVCSNGSCRNPSCLTSTSCLCATSTAIAQGGTPLPESELPVAGVSFPTIIGAFAGIILLVGALMLAL